MDIENNANKIKIKKTELPFLSLDSELCFAINLPTCLLHQVSYTVPKEIE